MKKIFFSGLSFFLLSSCAQLHHVQLSDIDIPPGVSMTTFEVKVSEVGVNLQEATDIAKAFTKDDKLKQQMQSVQDIISLFQMGPRTGNSVYVDNYAKNLPGMIRDKCPDGVVTGVTSIRETRKYPVISGEIVKIKGFCLSPRKGDS